MKTIPITAYYVARKIDLNLFAQRVPFPLTIKTRDHYLFSVEADQWLIVHHFGVVVFVNLDKSFLKKILNKKVQSCFTEPQDEKYSEEFTIIEDPSYDKDSVEYDSIKLKALTTEKLEIIEEIIAQSVAIDVFDGQVDSMLGQFSALTTELEARGRISARTPEILKLIGKNYSIMESMIVRLALLDKPEILWEDSQLETLFIALRSNFELEDRFTNLDYKLKFIQSNSELMLETIRSRRDQALEIIIVALILIEVVLFVYEIFAK